MTTQIHVVKQSVAAYRAKPNVKIESVEQAVYEVRITATGPVKLTMPDGKTREADGLLPIVLTISHNQVLAVVEESHG